jgi:hypothetical protein
MRIRLQESEERYRLYWLTLSPRDREKLPHPESS